MTVAFAGTGIQTRQTPKDLYNGTAGPAVEGKQPKERHGHLFKQAREIAHVFSFGSSGT
jgi:hypothetical protein